jgi:hypothetical protein
MVVSSRKRSIFPKGGQDLLCKAENYAL